MARIVLTPDEEACLRDAAVAPLKLYARWESRGERKQVFYYSREGGGEHKSKAMINLGQHGLLEPSEDAKTFPPTPAGLAWIAARDKELQANG